MIAPETIDVRELLFETTPFGEEQIERLTRAVGGPQCREVRQIAGELQEKVDAGDDSKRNLLALGVALHLLGRHRDAERYLSRISGDGLAEFYHAQVLMSLGRYEEAAKKFEEAASHGYDPVECTLRRVGAIRQAGHLDEAEKLLRSIAREGATRAEYCYQMGCILADRGDFLGANEYFERAVDMDPHHTRALFALAWQNDLMGNDEEAVKLYERALSKPPVYLSALINLGLLYEDAENYPAAAFCFRRVLEADPRNERARLYLEDVEASTDMYYDEEAIRRQKELEQVLRIPITDFELSARSRNCLEQAGIRTLGDLTRVTEEQLLAGKNFGETSLKEIREILESRGLRLGQALEQRPMPAVPAAVREDISPEERALLERSVADLNLSVRSRKCLSRLGITTIGDLVSRTPDELLSVRNFGVTSLNEIRQKLADLGLSLRND